jgi:predicted TIM-barrel fold metal-dependent hydrolase
MRDGKLVFDADMHVQEPPGIWVDHLDPRFRDRVQAGTVAAAMPIVDGRVLVDIPPSPQRREMRPTQMEDRYGDLARRGFDTPALLEAMDVEGIDVGALFPSYGLYVPWADHLAPDLAVALARAYNRWLATLCEPSGARLVPVALAPLHDPALAAAEARRAVEEDGARAVMVRPNPVCGRPISHPDHARFFAELVDLDVPMILHEGTGAIVDAVGKNRFDTWAGRHAASHPMEQMLALAGLVFDGVLEQHPGLRVGLFESGSGWLRWWLHRLDEHAEFLASELGGVRLKPSEYAARQCVISTESDDAFVGETLRGFGAECMVWASDFPHPEAPWPNAVDEFLAACTKAGISAADEATMLGATPCALYGLDPASLGRSPDLPRRTTLLARRWGSP